MTYAVHTLNAKLRRFVDANTVGVLATSSLDGRPRQSLVYFTRVDDRLLDLDPRRPAEDPGRQTKRVGVVVRDGSRTAVFVGDVRRPRRGPHREHRRADRNDHERITRAAEPPEPMSDEALAEVGRVILAITVERVTAANYIDAAANAGAQSR